VELLLITMGSNQLSQTLAVTFNSYTERGSEATTWDQNCTTPAHETGVDRDSETSLTDSSGERDSFGPLYIPIVASLPQSM
jgi:hypothetical protein